MNTQNHTSSRARRVVLLSVCAILVLLGTLLVPNGMLQITDEVMAEPYSSNTTAGAATFLRGVSFGTVMRQNGAGTVLTAKTHAKTAAPIVVQNTKKATGKEAIEVVVEPQKNGDAQDTSRSSENTSKSWRHSAEHTLIINDNLSYTVTVSYDDDAGIPSEAELVVDLLDNKDRELAKQRKESLGSRLDLEEYERVLTSSFLYIKLVAGGNAIQPQAPVELSIQTSDISPKESDAVEVVAFNSDEATVSSLTNLTGKQANGEEVAEPKETHVSCIVNELGEFGIATVAQLKFTWGIGDTKVQLWGPRNALVEVKDSPGNAQMMDDMQLLSSFAMQMEASHAWVPSLWLSSTLEQTDETDASGDVLCYELKDGKLSDLVFAKPRKNKYLPIEANGSYALLWKEHLQDLNIDAGDVYVTGTVPEDTMVDVQDVTDVFNDAAAVVGDAGDNTYGYETVAAYDVSFDVRGDAWQPDEDHKVSATITNDGIDPTTDLQVLHVADDGAADAVKVSNVKPGSVSFNMTDDGTYVVVERVSLVREFTASDNKTYKITVSYDGTAGLPREAELEVREVAGGEEYNGYVESAAKKLNAQKDDISYARAFDISFVDPQTGKECEPKGDVSVSIELLDKDANKAPNTSVVHFPNSSNAKKRYANAEIVDSDVVDGAVWFESNSFSVYMVLSYTSDQNLIIEAKSASKTYDGEALTEEGYELYGTLQNGHTLQSVVVDGSQTDAGTSENIPSGAMIVDGDGHDVTSEYGITYQNGTLTVNPQEVTLTANGGTEQYSGELINLGYTCSVDGLNFEGVTVASFYQVGIHEVTFNGVTIGETKDTTGNYVVSQTVNGLLVIEDTEGDESFVSKRLAKFEGNLAYYEIIINPEKRPLNDGHPLTLMDTFGTDESHPQSINYGSISATCDPVVDETATWDYNGYTGTFSIPDSTCVTITYYTRVKGNAGDEVAITNTAELGKMIGEVFVPAVSTTVSETVTVEPDINGTGGVYTIGLYVYADGQMETGLGGATFRLLDKNKRPIKYLAGDKAGQEVTFTTSDGDDDTHRGYVTIGLDEDADGLSIRKNTVYYLEMTTAPYTLEDGTYTYYKKDNTYYGFLITDDPDYTYGNVYSYFNGDVIKVRCYPQSGGVNVTKRFSGNYDLTPEQKDAITFTLQKESLSAAGGWVDVESHTYEEFSYGAINFDITAEELEDAATYRVIETSGLPEELQDTVELNTTFSVSYQIDGEPVEDDSGEFFVDPDDKTQVSYNFVFTNEYVDHRLNIDKVDELSGDLLPNAEFTVYATQDASATPVATYITDNNGRIVIRKSDTENYEFNTLYHLVETGEPEGYILPRDPQKTYFYFSENGESVPEGLPEGATATDLTTSYNVQAIINRSKVVDVPVTVSWGLNAQTGEDAWPDAVKSIEIGLYQSVGGAAAEPVTKNDVPLTATLTKTGYYDTTRFAGLPAQTESGEDITYSIVEEHIIDTADKEILGSYAQTNSISGTGWYIINNQDAVSVTIKKEWYQNDGVTPVDDASKKETVTFSLYRTTAEHDGTLTHDELMAALGSAKPVRTGLKLSYATNWTLTVPSLEAANKAGDSWYYYALEQIPDNQIDSYTVTPATDSDFRLLTIKNQQTPPTVTITAQNLEKTFGSSDPELELTATVMEEGSVVAVSGPDDEGKYTATVTKHPSLQTATIEFTVNRAAGEDVGTYAITPTGEQSQHGYRVAFVSGALQINQADVTIRAGATKEYGETDPTLVTIEGLPQGADESVLVYTVAREIGDDVGTYPITISGQKEQGNYDVKFVNGDLIVTPAPVNVTADVKDKTYGQDDPEFTATVTGLKYDDSASVIEYELTRTSGEDVGEYTITPAGDEAQGNYTVTYAPGTFTINRAGLEILVEDTNKIYGQGDPEWNVTIEGLQGEDDGGTLNVSDEGTRVYTYCKPGSDTPILTFRVVRESGEDVDENGYTVSPEGEEEQGNYSVTYKMGKLEISKADLVVTADNLVKPKFDPAISDPLLTATIDGWANNDESESTATASVDESTGVVTWTYTRNDRAILTFTLSRAAGEDEGEYEVTVAGENQQPNYFATYEPGTFRILSVFDVEVSQATKDPVDTTANPSYTYTASVNLEGTGISGKYNDNGFTDGILDFTLPQEGANRRMLKVPAGAKLTVTQNTTNAKYTTQISLDGNPYEGGASCEIGGVDDFYAIKFTHTLISLPVEARTTEGETEEGATVVPDSNGYIGIPEEAHTIDSAFAGEYQSRVGYTLPNDKYYVYDHASLYDAAGNAIGGASSVTAIKYDVANHKWQYKVGTTGTYTNMDEGFQLVLFYEPKYICQVGTQKFYTLNAAMDSIAAENAPFEAAAADAAEQTAREEHASEDETAIQRAVDEARQAAIDATIITRTIEMLVDYTMPSSDQVNVPINNHITLSTASTYSGGGSTAIITRGTDLADYGMWTNRGTLVLDNITLDGNNVAATSCMVASTSDTANLTVSANASIRNANGQKGGAVYVSSGTATIAGGLTNNSADKGAAVYVAGGSVTVDSTNIAGNSANQGGAIYIEDGTVTVNGTLSGNNAHNGNGGAAYVTGGTLNVTGTVSGNEAASGGAVFMTGGTLNSNGSVTGNSATNGGAFYIEGGTINITDGTASNNEASQSGGLIYGNNGDIAITGGAVSGNTATNGNGGAVCYEGGGSVTVSGGSVTGNTATNGNGGAIYQSSGVVTITNVTHTEKNSNNKDVTVEDSFASISNNSAQNGSAVFVADGAAYFSQHCEIKSNTATNGGAVGVGSTTARLHFSEKTIITNNTNSSIAQSNKKCNVYLDQDSDLVINVAPLDSNALIGIYVADTCLTTRGSICTTFGTYSDAKNVDSTRFSNDRHDYLKAYANKYKIIWSHPLQYNVRKLESYSTFPSSSNKGTELKKNTYFYPLQITNQMYDLAMSMYTNTDENLVYAYSYGNKTNKFSQYFTSINWDETNHCWKGVPHDGSSLASDDKDYVYIFYSNAAYISITNNSEYPLTIDPLTVLGKTAVTDAYGYPTVIDYLTQETLIPIADSVDDPGTQSVEAHIVEDGKIVLPAGGYAKLLFPGACLGSWSLSGVFEGLAQGETVRYTLDSLNEKDPEKIKVSLPGTVSADGKLQFSLSGTTLGVNKTYDILFEDPTPICKIEDNTPEGGTLNASGKYEHPFSTLKDAWNYVVAHKQQLSSTATIEMLMDYLQPGTDVLNIDAGYNITLTTATPRDSTDAEGKVYTYFGKDPTRATISRDSTNDGAAVIAEAQPDSLLAKDQCNSYLTITDMIFDGKALAKSGNGGAVSTGNNVVSISNCDFKGYQANRGGAVYVNGGDLVVFSSNFTDCYTKASTDKCGGGAIWTTAQVLKIYGTCVFTNCACNQTGNAQGGAVFHNIRHDGKKIYEDNSVTLTFPTKYSAASKTTINGCTFNDCFSLDGSGGTVESDAWEIEMSDCEFFGSYTGKSSGNGGALNAYTNDNVNYATIDSKLTIQNCWFEDASARRGTSHGGAIRSRTRTTLIENSTFKDCWANLGGAIYNDSGAEKSLTINGCTFDNCDATGAEGVVYTTAITLTIDDYQTRHSVFKDCSAPQYGGIYQNKDSATSTATITNASFEDCISTSSVAGALYTKAKTLTIKGLDGNKVTFTGCTASGNGGAVYHVGTTETLSNCSFEGCESGGSGGGAYLNAAMTISDASFTKCKAVNNGGGLYTKPTGTANTMTNCEYSGNRLSASESKGGSLYIEANTLTMTGCDFSASNDGITNQAAYGGGIYQYGGTLNYSSGTMSDCNANVSGGALYARSACNLGEKTNNKSVSISGCNAVASGGAIYHSANLCIRNASIAESCARQGGGVYSVGYLDVNDSAYVLSITDCKAADVTLNANGTVNVATSFNANNLGGGICKSGTANSNLKSSTGLISGCAAYDGGAIYYGSSGTLWLTNGRIIGNTAAHNGGGFYKANGAANLSGGAIGEVSSSNIAARGAGVFVANGQAMNIKGGSITHNHASSAGGGIAVGGSSSVLNFDGTVLVQNNTMTVEQNGESKDVACNVYLDQDTNSIIKTTSTALGANSYIGVYCSDEQDPSHGFSAMPFGTYNQSAYLDRFFNDRRPYYHGEKGSKNNQIVWCSFACKITDGTGNLLYTDNVGTPAVYAIVENDGGTGKTNAFGTLANNNPGLYRKVGNSYEPYSAQTSGYNGYQVQMLVQEYSAEKQISLKTNKAITLTTASTEPDECGFYYTGDLKHPYAAIVRKAYYGSMISLASGTPSLTLTGIIVDGGSENGLTSSSNGGILYIGSGSAVIGANATLRNSDAGVNSGGAVRVQSSTSNTLTLDGGTITNCHSTTYGGGVSVKTGTFFMNSGSITDCSAAYGGAVRVDTTMRMNGGSITGNSATTDGGGISLSSDSNNTKLFLTGSPVVLQNTLASESGNIACNVQLTRDTNEAINAQALNTDAEIGVYVPGVDNGPDATTSQFDKHGGERDPFGTWWVTFTEDDHPYCFVNDRDNILRGSQGQTGVRTIYWAKNYLLTLDTEVVSDLMADHTAEFTYTVRIQSEKIKNRTFSGVHFNHDGEATLTMTDETRPITIYFPEAKLDGGAELIPYTVTVNYTSAQGEDYDPSVVRNEDDAVSASTMSGMLGERIQESPPSGRSTVTFTHTRHTANLTVSKAVVSTEDEDKASVFPFTLTLGEATINKSYAATDAQGAAIEGGVAFTAGVANFSLADAESITIEGLPTDVAYTVAEDTSANPKAARIRTKIAKNDDDEVSARSLSAALGEDGDTVAFTNNFMEIVCKITNRSRALLYCKESDGKLVPAVFDNLADAFAKVNSGGLRTSSDGSVSGLLRIEMVVPEYDMQEQAVLNSGKTVVLSTAQKTDADGYPFIGEEGGTACVTRGNFTESMIADSGVLTLDKITLDGGTLSSNANGGIVSVNGAVKLTVNSDATLQNSTTSANGGAIWLHSGASLTMNGAIDNCSAASGGAVYADADFASITMIGTVSNCEATSGDGGGVCILTGGSLTVNSGAQLIGNKALSGNGGAVCSGANVIVRGSVGGAEAGEGNAAVNGGGIYMQSGTTFTMYSTGEIMNNVASADGGGLYSLGTTRISGGKVSLNKADDHTGLGGGVYAGETGSITISGSPQLVGNWASQGGAVYDGGAVTMAGGTISGNVATNKGGAVFVADGKTFTMTGGNINDGNKSPEGAVSAGGSNSVLNFSGNSVVSGNTSLDGATNINVYLGHDSNDIIRTTGLGFYANIGVYVADGEENALLYKHGIADRNFGTYTGTSPDSARLNKFHNDRDEELDGLAGDSRASNNYYVMWPGKNLYIRLYQFDIQTNDEGEPILNGQGGFVPVTDPSPIKGAGFTLTNVKTNVEVWSGQSSNKAESEGLVTIPWSRIEATGNYAATFKQDNYYELKQTGTATNCVLPAGSWLVHVLEGNVVEWATIKPGQSILIEGDEVTLVPQNPEETQENRTFDMEEETSGEHALGDTFILFNDRQPTITFNANGGKLYSASKTSQETERTDPVKFGTSTSVNYTISEKDPTWNTIFKNWNTEPDGSGVAYQKGSEYTFYRHSDNDDLTLYAQWVPVVCKITDRNGALLYVDGKAAVYETLEAGFAAYSTASFTNASGKRASARYIKMLIDSYDLADPIVLKNTKTKTGTLTTATSDPSIEGEYPFHSETGKTVCTIRRGFDEDASMITSHDFNLALENITLDGGAREGKAVSADGGIVSAVGHAYHLYVFSGSTLCNSITSGNGGAIYAATGTSVTVDAGMVGDNSATNGAGIYLAEGSTMYVSGAPAFNNNTVTKDGYDSKTNGGEPYANSEVEQDIFIAGYEGADATSLVVAGNLMGDVGSIWVWAEHDLHYREDKQFAILADSSYGGLDVFRNAQADDVTTGSVRADFLRGTSGKVATNVYWGTDGMDVSFQKIDGMGEAMDGAEFTLYANYDSSTRAVSAPYDNPAPATSADGTDSYTDSSGNVLDVGTVLFKGVPNGTYYLKETSVPSQSNYANDETYIVLVGSPAFDGVGSGILHDIDEEDVKAQTGTGDGARGYAIFLIDGASGRAVASTDMAEAPNIATFGIMNKSVREHKVILAKVGEELAALEGAMFRVFRADMTEVVGPDYDNTDHCYKSLASGVYLIDTLPEGKYYVVEVGAPTKEDGESTTDYNQNVGKVFELTINSGGVTQKLINGTQLVSNDATTAQQYLYSVGHST
ncbi:MAG: MBG domain-containing protein [Coriobacteriales bacterium]|nr:MBG domain-containing protein [Coriobacteriales bacterium]